MSSSKRYLLLAGLVVALAGVVYLRIGARDGLNAAVARALERDDLPPDDGCFEPLGDGWGYRLRLEWREPRRSDEVWQVILSMGHVAPWTSTAFPLRNPAQCSERDVSRALVVRENGDQFYVLRCANGIVQARVDRLSSPYESWPFGSTYPLGSLAPGSCW